MKALKSVDYIRSSRIVVFPQKYTMEIQQNVKFSQVKYQYITVLGGVNSNFSVFVSLFIHPNVFLSSECNQFVSWIRCWMALCGRSNIKVRTDTASKWSVNNWTNYVVGWCVSVRRTRRQLYIRYTSQLFRTNNIDVTSGTTKFC